MKYSRTISKRILLQALFFITYIVVAQDSPNFFHLQKTFSSGALVAHDPLGYIWISDIDGLYKYDGYDYIFTSYTEIFGPDFKNSRMGLFINDTQGNLWLTTYSGEIAQIALGGDYVFFNKTLPQNEKISRITSMKSNKDKVWFGGNTGILYRYDYATSSMDSILTVPKYENVPQQITDIAFSGSKQVWLSTDSGKIYYYALEENKLTELKQPYSNAINDFTKIDTDVSGNLWISTERNGLYSYSLKNHVFKQHDFTKTFNKNNNYAQFTCIFYDDSGKIWAGTDGYGLYRIDLETNNFTIYKQQDDNKYSISNNTILHINKDPQGNIWVVTKNGHINILPTDSHQIKYFSGSKNGSPTPVLSVLPASDGSLWIGTDGKGLNRVLPDNTSIQYNNEQMGPAFFAGNYIQKLVEDSNGNIWIGTYQNGLFLFTSSTGIFKKLPINNSSGQSSSDIRYLYKDSKKRIWATSSIGIHVFSESQKVLAFFEYNTKGLATEVCQSLIEKKNGEIWIGQDGGLLFKFLEDSNTLQKSTFKSYDYYEQSDGNFNNYDIISLVEDKNENLWILCTSDFLIHFNTQNDTFESYENKEAIKDISFASILVDAKNNLWLGSGNGVHEYNPDTGSLKSYYRIDGMQGDVYKRRSAYKCKNGTFYFGGENGVSAFEPEHMFKKESISNLYINAIEILNKPAREIIPDQMVSGAEYVKTLKLESGQSSFSFQFSAIQNILDANYNYTYRLLGFNDQWILAKNERIATYTNIPHGDYTFQVKAGTKKGEWNIGKKQINIHIKPYWWQSNLAFGFYTIFLFLLFLGIILWVRLRNKLQREAWQNGQEKELYSLKMNFFAKMSHEIHTPLTLILAPINDMMKRAISHNNHLLIQRLYLIKNNAERLSRISNELMTVRNRELGKLRIYASKNDIVDDLKKIAASFTEQASFKQIEFIQKYSSNEIFVWYDREKMEHIFYNLFSNAFKFTPRQGMVSLEVKVLKDSNHVVISITDSGPGIAAHDLENIFELYYQSKIGNRAKGLGIGLALSKEMIDIHHGYIDVSSKLGEGTKFTVKLSTLEDVFSDEEKTDINALGQLPSTLQDDFFQSDEKLAEKISASNEHEHRILIVEDNIEMQMFLQDFLHEKFDIIIAENGIEGIALAKKNNPSIIISDVMMPVMNGIEMSRILQKNKQTSHIPIILLTAKNSKDSKLIGLQTGAIAYFQKPFDTEELLLHIKNIISNEEKVALKTKIDIISTPKKNVIKSKDDFFIENLVNKLSAQLENPQFKLEDLSNSLSMSYSVIYRKCQELTGKTLVEYFRSIKMKRGALFILKDGYSISEAAFMVGYKDTGYFTKCFKYEFGKTPTDLKQEMKKIGMDTLIKKYKIQID